MKGAPGKLKSIATKVMIQLASKLGGEPWRVAVPKKDWMVCGYDTYHDARQKKAVGAFIASTNKEFTRYVSSVEMHENNEEISASFSKHMIACLRYITKQSFGFHDEFVRFYYVNCQRQYYLANRSLPSNIFIYRDGVGAGDIARTKTIEIASLQVN